MLGTCEVILEQILDSIQAYSPRLLVRDSPLHLSMMS